MTDLQSLLSRIEAASGPNFQLECDIDRIVAGAVQEQKPSGLILSRTPPAYTTSLDAAVGLVEKMLPDHRPSIYQLQSGKWEAEVAYPKPRRHQFQGTALATVSPNPAANGALALCSALLSELIESRSAAPVNGGTPETDTAKGEQHKTPPQQPRDPKSENRGAGEL